MSRIGRQPITVPSGVTVTALAPGPVSTDFWTVASWEMTGGQRFEQAVPGPVWVTAQDAAKAAVLGGQKIVTESHLKGAVAELRRTDGEPHGG